MPYKQGNEWIVVGEALMKKKETPCYDVILKAVQKAWMRLGVSPVFRLIFMDFENAEIKAAQNAFGTNVSFISIALLTTRFRK